MNMYRDNCKSLSNFKVKGQGHSTGFLDTLPLRDTTMLLIAARPIAIGRRQPHGYKYHSLLRRLLRTALALCKA